MVKIRNRSGVLLLNALPDCLKINRDMLWYKLDFSSVHVESNIVFYLSMVWFSFNHVIHTDALIWLTDSLLCLYAGCWLST